MALPKQTQNISSFAKVILLLGANWSIMAGASLSPVMPQMMAEFSEVPRVGFWVSMIITVPAIFVVVGGPIIGYLTDRFGRKPVLVFSLAGCGLAGSAGYFLGHIGIILITRALVGLSIAGTSTATNALIGDYFKGQQRAKFMGLQAAVSGLAGVVFLPIGGFLAEINWHLAFLTYSPLLLLFPLALLSIHEPAVITDQIEGEIHSHLQLDATKIYIFSAIFLTHFAFTTIPVYIAYFMTALLDVGGSVVGLAGAAASVFSFIAGIIYERIGRRVNFEGIAVANLLLFSVGFVALGLAASWSLVIIGYMILGFCMGLNNSNMTTWLASTVTARVRGRANGIFMTMMSLGPFIASFVYSPIVTKLGYGMAYVFSGGITLLTGVAGLFIHPSKSSHQEES